MEIVPDRNECRMLMEQHGMLDNIVAHSLEVSKVALFLSEGLNQKGQRIDLRLVEAGALLHDIAKTGCLRTKEDHTQAGYRLLKQMGYERVGRIVGQHVWLDGEGDPFSVSEEEVVNYADKRVRHDQIVSLEERFVDLRQRYGKDDRSIAYLERMEKAILGVEAKIFQILGSDPHGLSCLSEVVVPSASTE
jgi:putative nucleotidyltransferase with HDIG domain